RLQAFGGRVINNNANITRRRAAVHGLGLAQSHLAAAEPCLRFDRSKLRAGRRRQEINVGLMGIWKSSLAREFIPACLGGSLPYGFTRISHPLHYAKVNLPKLSA